FGLSQKLTRPQPLGALTDSDTSGAVASSGDAEGACAFPGATTSLVCGFGSGAESNAHAYTGTTDTRTRLLIRPNPLIRAPARRDSRHRHGHRALAADAGYSGAGWAPTAPGCSRATTR